jgi:hypothetical protein
VYQNGRARRTSTLHGNCKGRPGLSTLRRYESVIGLRESYLAGANSFPGLTPSVRASVGTQRPSGPRRGLFHPAKGLDSRILIAATPAATSSRPLSPPRASPRSRGSGCGLRGSRTSASTSTTFRPARQPPSSARRPSDCARRPFLIPAPRLGRWTRRPGAARSKRRARKRIRSALAPEPQHLGPTLIERGIAAVLAFLGRDRTPAITGSLGARCQQRGHHKTD